MTERLRHALQSTFIGHRLKGLSPLSLNQPTHMENPNEPKLSLLNKIAQSIEQLTKTIQDTPSREGNLLAQTLAENTRLKEALNKANEEMLTLRMDATKDPVLIAAIKDSILYPRKS